MQRLLMVCVMSAGLSSVASSQVCHPELSQVISPAMGEEGTGLGFSIEIQDDWAFIAAGLDTVDGVNSGSVHIYHFDGTQWVDQGRVVPPDPQAFQYFGETISIDGDTMMIGALGDSDFGAYAGAVYVFDRVDGDWEFMQKLTASDGREGQGFRRVFLRGDMAVVGATASIRGKLPGAAYVFERDESGWLETQKLTPSDSQNGDLFGASCEFEDDWMVIGAPFNFDSDEFIQGGAYVFHREGGSWVETQRLGPELFGPSSADFGIDVSIESNQIMVGAPSDGMPGSTGSVYVLEQVGSEWIESQRLRPNSNATRGFGYWVEVDQGRLMSGAPSYSTIGSNEVELFHKVNGIWMSGGSISSPVSDGNTIFGQRFALGEDIAMILALDSGTDRGDVFVYSLECDTCAADLSGDTVLTTDDVNMFLAAYSGGSAVADFTLNGTLDFFDVSAFVQAFHTGCP
ncbi:MAG: FG-GAP repeat protein [Phycisphaerales bacterium]|nr:FG-GAP repeat protein [Phycisphaerales bacterium]